MIQPLPRERPILGALGDAVADWGYGAATGGFDDAFGIGAQRGAQMQPSRDQERYRRRQETEKLRRAAMNAKYLVGNEALQQAVTSGDMDFPTAYRMWQEERAAGAPKAPRTGEVNGRLVNLDTGAVLADFSDPAEPPKPTIVPAGSTVLGPDNQLVYTAPAARKPPTEAQQRMSMINNVVQDEASVLLGDPATGAEGVYGALGDVVNQVLDANVAGQNPGRALTSAEYQRAVSAVETISQHYLYALSGQAAPDGEVKRVARTLMPVIGENAASVLEKKRRLQSYLDTIAAFVQQSGQPGGATSGPEVGAVEDGYRYLGGDPADPNSWEPAQ